MPASPASTHHHRAGRDAQCLRGHPINPFGPERRAQHLFGYNENSLRASDLNCGTVRWKPSFCPRVRDYPVAFGYSNSWTANRAVGHGVACSQLIVEVVIKTLLVPISHRPNFSLRIQKLQWQAAHRHETCGSNNCRRAYQGSGSTNEDASARHSVVSCGHCKSPI